MAPPAPLQTLPADEPLGRYYYAPQVRLLVGNAGQGTDPVVLPPTGDADGVSHPVHADIEKSEVTQVHHGPSQASMPPLVVSTSRPRPLHSSPDSSTETPPLVVCPRTSPPTSIRSMPRTY